MTQHGICRGTYVYVWGHTGRMSERCNNYRARAHEGGGGGAFVPATDRVRCKDNAYGFRSAKGE